MKSLGRTADEVLRLAGWKQVSTLPEKAQARLEEESSAAIKIFDYVTEVFFIFHHEESDRYMVITDGGSALKVDAEGLIIATANPERLDIDDKERAKTQTIVHAITMTDKMIADWLMWVGAQRCYPLRKPES
jgi:hypothetical protein